MIRFPIFHFAGLNPTSTKNFLVQASVTNVSAGVGFAVTVTARDVNNATDTSYTGTVHFTSSDSQATLSAGGTIASGVGTFSATLASRILQTITARDTHYPVINGRSGAISITAAVASHIVLAPSGPIFTTQGTSTHFTITAFDQFNNQATSYRGTVAFSSNDPRALLPPNRPFGAGDNGRVTTLTATLGPVASVTMTATDSVLPATTDTFSVTLLPAAVNKTMLFVAADATASGILLGNGDGTFQTLSPTIPTTGDNIIPADLNNDGRTDASMASATLSSSYAWMGFGDGTFNAPPIVTIANGAAGADASILVCDLDGNGVLDWIIYGPNNMNILTGAGNGSFTSSVTYSTGLSNANIVACDLNNDGKADLLVVGTGVGAAGVMLGNGNGTFQAISTFATAFGAQNLSGLGDINGDGIIDFVVTDGASPWGAQVFLGNGNGTFQALSTFALPTGRTTGVVVDVNGDGVADLVFANYGANNIQVMLGNGDGTFQTGNTYAANTKPMGIIAADLNGDGKMDLALSSWQFTPSPGIIVLMGNGDGTFGPASNVYVISGNPQGMSWGNSMSPPGPLCGFHIACLATPTLNSGFTVTVFALDSGGGPAVNYTGTVQLLSSDTAAVISGSTTLTLGRGTFSVTLKTAGNTILTARDTTVTTLASNKTVPVGTVTHFTVTAPATATIGTAIVFTATALAVNNGTVTGYTGTVTFSCNDLGARLPYQATLTNGVGTFSASMYTVGSVTLTVADSAAPAIKGSSSGITVANNVLTFDAFQHNVGTDVESYTLPIGNPWVSVPCMTRPSDLYTMACAAGGANNSIGGVSTFPAPGGTLTNVGQTDVYFSWELPAQTFPGSNNTSLVMKGEKNTSTGGAGCYVFLNSTGTFRFEVNNNGIDTTSAGGGWGNDITNTASFSGAAFQRITAKCITGNGPSGSNTYTIYQDGVHTLPTALTFSPTNPPNDSGTGAHDSPTLNVRSGTLFGINEPNTSTGNNVLIRSVMCNSIAWGTPPFWAVPTTGGFIALPYFTGSPGAETLSMAGSLDGAFFTGIPSCDATAGSGTAFVPATGSGVNSGPTVRDPALFADSRMSSTVRAIVHTSTPFQPGNTSFGVVTSTDGQKWATKTNPNFLAGQTPGGITGLATLWAPNWFLDPNGPVDANGTPRFYDDGTHGSALHVFFVGQTSGGTNTSTIYETHPTAADFSTWSPAVLVGGLPVPAIDPCCVWDGANYFMWIRHVNLDFVVVYKSASLLSGYSLWQSTSWLGLSSGAAEAPQCVKSIDGTKWILHVDTIPGGGSGINYATMAVGTHDWTKDNTGSMTAWSGFNSILVPYTTGPRSGKMCVIK